MGLDAFDYVWKEAVDVKVGDRVYVIDEKRRDGSLVKFEYVYKGTVQWNRAGFGKYIYDDDLNVIGREQMREIKLDSRKIPNKHRKDFMMLIKKE